MTLVESSPSDVITVNVDAPPPPPVTSYLWTDISPLLWSGDTGRYYTQFTKWASSAVVNQGVYTTPILDLEAITTATFFLSFNAYIPDPNSQDGLIEIRKSDDGAAWGAWSIYNNGLHTTRFFQMRITMTSILNLQMFVNNLILDVDVPDRIEYYHDLTIIDANAGYTIIFANNTQSRYKTSFSIVPAVVATPLAQEGEKIGWAYSNKTVDAVTIKLVDLTTGSFITGVVDVICKGY